MLFNIHNFNSPKLGHLPKEWKVVQLKEVADFSRKPRDLVLKNFAKIPFISMDLIPDDGTQMPGYIFKPGNRISSGTYCEPGDILVAKITPCLENGKQCVVPNFKEGFAFATTEVYALKPKHSIIDCYYLFAILRSPAIRKELASKMEGSTGRQRLPKHVLENLEVPLPPLPEQRAIAHVLRTVQRAKEATERVIAALKELKKSLMKHLFTYGPVPLDAADQVALQDTLIGPIPAHWRVVRLGELWEQGILWIKNGFPQGRFNEQGKGVPHLRPFNVNDSGKVSLHQIKFVPPPPDNSPYWLRIGDIIFNNTNSEALVGKVAFFDLEGRFVLSNHMTIVRVQNPRVLSNVWLAGWLLYLWHQGFTQTLARRHVNQASIGLARLKSIPIPLPPLDEQREIARILQTVDRKIEAEENRKRALEGLFKSLLHHLMTAKVRMPKEVVEQFEGPGETHAGEEGP